MKNNHPHTGMQAVFSSCLWIYEAFGNTPYIISWDLFLYAALVFAYSATVMKHEGIKNKIKEKDRKCFFWKLIRARFWTGHKQNGKPSWDFERSAYRKLYLSYIYLYFFEKILWYSYIYFLFFHPLFCEFCLHRMFVFGVHLLLLLLLQLKPQYSVCDITVGYPDSVVSRRGVFITGGESAAAAAHRLCLRAVCDYAYC